MLKEAADNGNGHALQVIGYIYEHGLGDVEKDESRALDLYKESERKGFNFSSGKVEKLERRLPAD